MCCDECCPGIAAAADMKHIGAAFEQVWTELDALRQEREVARTEIWDNINNLGVLITRLEARQRELAEHINWLDKDSDA